MKIRKSQIKNPQLSHPEVRKLCSTYFMLVYDIKCGNIRMKGFLYSQWETNQRAADL